MISKKIYEDVLDYIHDIKLNPFDVDTLEDIKTILEKFDFEKKQINSEKIEELSKYINDIKNDPDRLTIKEDMEKILKILNIKY